MANGKLIIKYAGSDLPSLQVGGLRLIFHPIDDAERSASGDLMLEEIAFKRKIGATFPPLTGDETHHIMATLELNRSGHLEYFDIAKGGVHTIPVYYGAGVSVDMMRYDDNMALQLYSSLSINFIEM